MVDPALHVCSTCAGEVPQDVRFCPQCGSRLGADGPPVTWGYAERRLFGLAPPVLVLALALLALVLAVVLFAAGHWLAGLVMALAAAGFAAVFLGAARQSPQGRLAPAALAVSDRVRWRAGFAWVSAASWVSAVRPVVRLRVVRWRLRRERRRLVYALGEAVLAGGEGPSEALRSEALVRSDEIDECERELRLALTSAHDRVGRERAVVQPTRILDGARSDRDAGADRM